MYKLDDALLLNCRGQLTPHTNKYNSLTLTILCIISIQYTWQDVHVKHVPASLRKATCFLEKMFLTTYIIQF